MALSANHSAASKYQFETPTESQDQSEEKSSANHSAASNYQSESQDQLSECSNITDRNAGSKTKVSDTEQK